uniref:Putative ATPase domain containing protein n=1 Tax=viral metagenome TaxID=1070528 RepID=A0A6M3K3W0_9ZZZZ
MKKQNGNLKKLFGANPKAVYDYNLQRSKIVNLTNDQPLESMNPIVELDTFLTANGNMVLIDYVFMEEHARMIVDYLAAWSQDERLHKNKSTVLVFTSDANLFPETLRRLCYTITICPSTEEERRAFLQELADEIQAKFATINQEIKIDVTEEVVQASSGLDLHSIETASIEAFYQNRTFAVSAYTEHKIKILQTYDLTYTEPKIGFNEVGGYKMFKEYIRKKVILPIRDPEKAKYYGVSLPRGIIFFGPPGTGKTYFAEALAFELGLPMIKLNSSDLLRGVVGESERRVKQITRLIESLSPVLIFIDEIDAMGSDRGKEISTDSGVSRRIKNQLLEWLGDRNRRSFPVGATNLLESMDTAFIRTGRFDEVVIVLPPDEEARFEILKIHSSVRRKMPLKGSTKDHEKIWRELAKDTYLWTGAELEKLAIDAGRVAMENDTKFIGMDQFREAMKSTQINEKARQDMIRHHFDVMNSIENVNKQFLMEAFNDFDKHTSSKDGDSGRISALIENIQNK